MAKKRVDGAALTPTVSMHKGKPEMVRDETKSEPYFSVYANDLRVQTGIWDVRIKFGEVDGDSPAKLKVKVFGEIRMAPQLAKKLTMILASQLKAYEDKYGTLPMLKED